MLLVLMLLSLRILVYISAVTLNYIGADIKTTKLCYRKDDRDSANMQCALYMGALKIFGTP